MAETCRPSRSGAAAVLGSLEGPMMVAVWSAGRRLAGSDGHQVLTAAGCPASNLWPIVVAPLLAALVSDRTARLLPRAPGAWVLAAMLILAPAWVAQGVLNRALSNLDVVHTWRGVIRFWITPFAASCLIAY